MGRSVLKETNTRYRTLRTMTKNKKILLTQLFGCGCELSRCYLILGSSTFPGFCGYSLQRAKYTLSPKIILFFKNSKKMRNFSKYLFPTFFQFVPMVACQSSSSSFGSSLLTCPLFLCFAKNDGNDEQATTIVPSTSCRHPRVGDKSTCICLFLCCGVLNKNDD